MTLSAQGIAARWLLLATAASTTLLHLVKADDNFTDTYISPDFDWLNATQLLQMFEYENNTEGNSTEGDVDVDAGLEIYSVGETITEESTRSSPDDSPFEMLRKHRHYARFVFMVVVMHVAVVGVCITIYSLVHCKVRTLKKRKRAEAQRILRLTNLQFQHVPNSSDCPCDGCIVAREMLQGLILQQMQELVEC